MEVKVNMPLSKWELKQKGLVVFSNNLLPNNETMQAMSGL